MRYILNCIYLILLLAYLPVIAYQRLAKGKKRPGLWGKFIGQGPVLSNVSPERLESTQETRCILFHAVSLGEVHAIRSLVTEFQKQNPDREIVVSTTTQTGFDAAKKAFKDIEICLLPFDFSWAVKRFLNNLNPEKVILAELEIWPNLIAECQRQSISIILVNARLSESSFKKYQRFSFLFSNVLRSLTAVCCQNETYAERFEKLGVDSHRISVSGNLKYDDLLLDRFNEKSNQFRELACVETDQKVFLAGSTQAPEESIAIETYLQVKDEFPNLRFFVCPRHPERFDEVASLLESYGIKYSRRSSLADDANSDCTNGDSSKLQCERVVLLDSMGELKYWWGLTDIAFVGGSFGNRGGQNMIEPVASGAKVCFGPHTRNFVNEVNGLLEYKAAVQLQQPAELSRFVSRCLSDERFSNDLTENSRQFLQAQSSQDSKAWQATIRIISGSLQANDANAKKRAA